MDTGFQNTHNVIVRVIRLSIETGCVTGSYFSLCKLCIFAHCLDRIVALSAGITIVLVFLPGHPSYYAGASSIVAKAYSNSMMAMLNSRVKPVSNTPASAAPLWNEELKSMESLPSAGGSHGFVFRRNSEISYGAPRASEIVLPPDIST